MRVCAKKPASVERDINARGRVSPANYSALPGITVIRAYRAAGIGDCVESDRLPQDSQTAAAAIAHVDQTGRLILKGFARVPIDRRRSTAASDVNSPQTYGGEK